MDAAASSPASADRPLSPEVSNEAKIDIHHSICAVLVNDDY